MKAPKSELVQENAELVRQRGELQRRVKELTANVRPMSASGISGDVALILENVSGRSEICGDR